VRPTEFVDGYERTTYFMPKGENYPRCECRSSVRTKKDLQPDPKSAPLARLCQRGARQ